MSPAASTRARPWCVYTDGASRGNPGHAGAGWVLYDAAQVPIATGGQYLDRRTNNEAEYAAALLGLQAALQHGATHIILRADSELMVRQLEGRYQVRNARLQPLHAAASALLKQFEDARCEHVRRALNAAADAAANAAIDAALAECRPLV